jgi:hypothetical protein
MQRMSAHFAAHDGLATIAQLRHLGVTDGMVRQRLRTGEWERFDESVVGLAGVPVTWRRQVRAALMSAGSDAAVSGPTAARLHGFDGFADEHELHLVAFHHRHLTTLPGIRLHRSRVITERECLEVEGMTTVSRAVALVQVAGERGDDAAAQALDGLLRERVSPVWLRRTAAAMRRPGVSGPARVIRMLDERVDQRLPRSWFQRLAARVLASRGIPMVDELPVYDGGRRMAELDLAIPSLQIGVECQSWRWHATPSARAADARRKRRLRLLGWELVEVWWADLERPDEVAEEVIFLAGRRLDEAAGRGQ